MSTLIIIDSCAADQVEDGATYAYVKDLPGVQVIPARLARDEAQGGRPPPVIDAHPSTDAPKPFISNDPTSRTNDPGVVIITHAFAQLKRAMSALYANPANHTNDTEIAAAALEYGEQKLASGEATRCIFVSADRGLCRKAEQLVKSVPLRVEIMFARPLGAKGAHPVRDLGVEFPP